jgi:hypothetical protein
MQGSRTKQRMCVRVEIVIAPRACSNACARDARPSIGPCYVPEQCASVLLHQLHAATHQRDCRHCWYPCLRAFRRIRSIQDRAPLPKWSTSRVTLIGGTSPFTLLLDGGPLLLMSRPKPAGYGPTVEFWMLSWMCMCICQRRRRKRQ